MLSPIYISSRECVIGGNLVIKSALMFKYAMNFAIVASALALSLMTFVLAGFRSFVRAAILQLEFTWGVMLWHCKTPLGEFVETAFNDDVCVKIESRHPNKQTIGLLYIHAS